MPLESSFLTETPDQLGTLVEQGNATEPETEDLENPLESPTQGKMLFMLFILLIVLTLLIS